MTAIHETARLILFPPTEDLAERAAAYYVRNRDFLTPFDPVREERWFTAEGQRERMALEVREAEEDRGYRFYLAKREAPEELIGYTSLGNLVRGAFHSCFLGYKLDAACLRRGYMTEAVRETVRIAFRELGLHRIEANIMPRNSASLGVVKKAGFEPEGIAIRYLKINGVWEDHIHMVIRDE